MRLPEECERRHSESRFSVKEQKSEVIFENENLLEVFQYLVDGCIFTIQDQKRCDWLINVRGAKLSIFVELKGSDIEAAYEQLKHTQMTLLSLVNDKRIWIISYSGSPRMSTSFQNLILKARSECNGAKLRIEASPYTHFLK